ncbi:MAG: UPF0158 family protein [Methylotenera sp.]|nr:UPF0158 family protein [Methylotenera sp.]
MLNVDFDELLNALEFVSANTIGDEEAYICQVTGTIYWISSEVDLEPDTPEDIEISDLYIAVPHKKDLGLGQGLAMAFIDQELPDDYNTVASYFRKKGAYRRFKDLLEERGQLETWYVFENEAINKALLDWCQENSIQPTNPPVYK